MMLSNRLRTKKPAPHPFSLRSSLRGLGLALSVIVLPMAGVPRTVYANDPTDIRLSGAEQKNILTYLRLSGVFGDGQHIHPLSEVQRYSLVSNIGVIILRFFLGARDWRIAIDKTDHSERETCSKILDYLRSWKDVHHMEPAATLFQIEDVQHSPVLSHLKFPAGFLDSVLDQGLHAWFIAKGSEIAPLLPDVETLKGRFGRTAKVSGNNSIEAHGMRIYLPGALGANSLYQLSMRNNVAFIQVDGISKSTTELLVRDRNLLAAASYLSGTKYIVVECDFADRAPNGQRPTQYEEANTCHVTDVVYTPIARYSYIDSASKVNGIHIIVGLNSTGIGHFYDALSKKKLYGLLELVTEPGARPRLQLQELTPREDRLHCEFESVDPSELPTFREIMQ